MTKRTGIIANILTYSILLALMIVASLYDMRINDIAYIGGGISVIGAVLGKLPAFVMASMALGILFKSALHKERRYKFRMPLLLIYGFAAFACGFMMGYSAVDDVMDGSAKLIVAAITCVAAGGSTLIFANMVSLDYINKLKKWAMLTIVCVGIISLFTLLIKVGWGRERYVDIINNDKQFTAWYLPQGIKSGGTSMPSGHTALAACIFLLPKFYQSLPDMKQYAPSTYLLAWVITAFVGLTRLLSGYHFLSDITLSIIIAYTVVLLVFYIGYGKNSTRMTLNEDSFLSKF